MATEPPRARPSAPLPLPSLADSSGLWFLWSVYLSSKSALLAPRQPQPSLCEIIHLAIHLQGWKPFITRPETSINYSGGGKGEAFERQIHLDLIGKQVYMLSATKQISLKMEIRKEGREVQRRRRREDR